MPLHSSLPKIEGFQPIPNAVMIPFMEAQSAALAYGFGLNYEYGKRKIRSMSNEEYNSLTSEDITNMSNAHTHIILSQFQLQVPRVMPMQKEIFIQYVAIEKEKIIQNIALAKWIAANAPQLIVEGAAGDDPSSIRETPTPTPQGNIIGYIDGVPQYGTTPKTPAPTSRRTSGNAQQAAEKLQLGRLYRNMTGLKAIITRLQQNLISRGRLPSSSAIKNKTREFHAAGKNYASAKTKYEIKYQEFYLP